MNAATNPVPLDLANIGPGVYFDLSNEDYHATTPGISSTGIKRILLSPLHFKDRIDEAMERRAAGLPPMSTPTLAFGNQYHTLILEPSRFKQKYMGPVSPKVLKGALKTIPEMKEVLKGMGVPVGGTRPELIARLKEVDQSVRIYEDVLAEAIGGKEIIQAEDWDRLMGMKKMLLAHPSIGRLFDDGRPEVSVYWTDEETGVLCKIRPDWLLPITTSGLDDKGKPIQSKRHMLIDLKSAIDASREGFEKAVYNFGYHISAAMYLEGWEKATGEDLSGYFLFVAQEHQRPYALAPYPIDDDALAIGKERFHEALRTYATCLEADEWPGYPAHFQPVGLPPWAMRREQSR